MKKKKTKAETYNRENSALNMPGLPLTAFDMVNRYGTYEIQATADTDNQYPAIAQGYNPEIIKNDCENPKDGRIWEKE